MKKEKRSIRQLAQKLMRIRRKPVSQEQIDEFNKIITEDERPDQKPDKKIARSPETSL